MLIEGRDGDTIYFSMPKLNPADIKQRVPETNKHPHLCLLKLWVKDCEVSSTPHRWWKFKGCDSPLWHQCDAKTPMFIPGWEYKRVEPNCIVNGEEVPLGLETIEQFNALFSTDNKFYTWIPDTLSSAWVCRMSGQTLCSSPELRYLIAHRLIYTERTDAVKRAKAILKWRDIE